MSWTERPIDGIDTPDEEPALTGGPGQVPTAGDLSAKPRNGPTSPPEPDDDERRTDPIVAATTLDSGDPGLGLGGHRDASRGHDGHSDTRDDDVPRDRGGEIAGGAAGAVGGAVVGTIVAGPAGAVVGGIVGAAAGDAAGRAAERQGADAGADGGDRPHADRDDSEADPLT